MLFPTRGSALLQAFHIHGLLLVRAHEYHPHYLAPPKALVGKWNQRFLKSDLPSPSSCLSPIPPRLPPPWGSERCYRVQSAAAPSLLTKLQPSSRWWIWYLGPRGRAALQTALTPLWWQLQGPSWAGTAAGQVLALPQPRRTPRVSAYTVLLFQQRRPGIHVVLHVKTGILSAIYTQFQPMACHAKTSFSP